MAIRVQRHANVSKQATLLDGLDVSTLKWRVFGCGLNRFVHEGMNHISNAKVHLKTHSGNVNIFMYHTKQLKCFTKIIVSSAATKFGVKLYLFFNVYASFNRNVVAQW